MKKQRALPFGYAMQGGRIETDKTEARIVRRVYKLYENGGSLDSISALLTKQPVPYFDVNPEWNKHKVKRILENEKYTGADGFPVILDRETFLRVRELHGKKTQVWQEPSANPEKHIWKRFTCAECGSRLKRIGGRKANSSLLECEDCGIRIEFPTDELLRTLMNRFQEAVSSASQQEPERYVPTAEIMRLENDIARRIERPTDEQTIRRLVLEAAAKRYTLCPSPIKQESKGASTARDWQAYKEQIETALIKSAGEITIRLKQERT